MNYRIGLDIGIASVGWSVVEHDEKDRPCRIVDLGVRKFIPAEKPKTGESPAVDRRIARGIRRNLRRKRGRLNKIKTLLQDSLLDGKDIVFSSNNLYELRAKALDERVTDNDLARIIYSISKHRGFKSNRKAETKEKDNAKLLGAIKSNSENIKKYRSVGEMYIKNEKYFEIREKEVDGEIKTYKNYYIRNRDGNFENTLLREDLLNEIKTIFEKQKLFGNKKISNNFVDEILKIFTYQRSYDEGPALPSPYHVEFNVGSCTYIPNEKRAPKASFSYEYFTALCDINHMTINGEKLTEDARKKIIENFMKTKEITYEKVRKILNLKDEDNFGGKSGCEKDSKVFIKRPFSHQVMKILNLKEEPTKYQNMLNDIAYVISMFKTDDKRIANFNKFETTKNLSEEIKQNLCEIDANKFGNLSIKALDKMIPFLEKGEVYSSARDLAGLKSVEHEKKYKLSYNEIDEINDITSPVVRRAISQTIKVVNAIIDKYGSPCAIYIEFAREMGKDFKERKKIEKQILENSKNNERRYSQLKEFGIDYPSGEDIIKLKLYEQQEGKCLYSGKSFVHDLHMSMKDIISNNNTQIDHIIPYSRCYDDSLNNKVLVLASENQKKGNRIPFEYFGNDEKRWFEFQTLVETYFKYNRKKRENLLKKSLTEQQEQELNNRALNDTRYIARFAKDMFENYLIFKESSLNKKPVRTINGGMTSFLRKIWGLKKERFEDDKHHAVDACVIACTDNGLIQRVTKFLQAKNAREIDGEDKFVDKSTGIVFTLDDIKKEYGKNFQMPYEVFKQELEILISQNVLSRKQELMELGYTSEELQNIKPLYVSRMVNHKVTGPMHEQTIRSKKLVNDNDEKLKVVTKTSLNNLKLNESGEIKDYPLKFRNDDRVLYEALKRQLFKYDGDAKRAFKEPFYKPTKSGKNMNIVKTVKLEKTINDAVEVNEGLADNASMIRIDIFEKLGKFYFIPVYAVDYYHKKLPNKICKGATAYKDWPVVDDTYKFKFSLFQNDVLKIKSKKGINFVPCDKNAEKKAVVLNDLFVYYCYTGRATASISVQTLDGKYESLSVGIQNLIEFEKYEIDILGNIKKCGKEFRKEFN